MNTVDLSEPAKDIVLVIVNYNIPTRLLSELYEKVNEDLQDMCFRYPNDVIYSHSVKEVTCEK